MKLVCKMCDEEITTTVNGSTANQAVCLMCLVKSCGGIWDKNAEPDPQFIAFNPQMSSTKGRWIAREGITMEQVWARVCKSLAFSF